MAPMNLVFGHSLRERTVHAHHYHGHVPEAKLPYALAVPLIIALSAGLWVGVWKLGTLMMALIR